MRKKPVVVAITGATGTILGFELVRALLALNQPVDFIMSEKSLAVVLEEQQLKFRGSDPESRREQILEYLGRSDTLKTDALTVHSNHRLDAPPSSGTYLTAGMVIIPCSMATLGRLSSGVTDNLVTRAADVTLKEGRKLIVVPRETPLNQIHLRNMMTLSQCGACILPPMLSFYLEEYGTMAGQIAYTLGKVLDQLGLEEHTLSPRWGRLAVRHEKDLGALQH